MQYGFSITFHTILASDLYHYLVYSNSLEDEILQEPTVVH